MHYRRADDDYVGSSSIGGIRLKPGIAKGNVCRFRDHVVAEIAGGILKETRAPIAIDQVPPILAEAVSVLERQLSGVPVCGAFGIFQTKLHLIGFTCVRSHLPSKAIHHPRAFHVAAIKRSEERRDGKECVSKCRSR